MISESYEICTCSSQLWLKLTRVHVVYMDSTFRETAMLYQEGVSTSVNLQRVATVIAHELAHQWFGNLVTPTWWTDLWLNEGFATYVEYIGANAVCLYYSYNNSNNKYWIHDCNIPILYTQVEPEWKILDQFVIQQHFAFALDALESSHQISIEVGHPDEINDIFDRISYAKGKKLWDLLLVSSVEG